MKKFLIVLSTLFISCILFVSCNGLFTKVQVKANPELYVPLGTKTVKLRDYLTTEKMAELFGNKDEESENPLKIYEYTGNSKSQALSFLMYYPILEMDLDFSEYMKDIDLENLNQAIPRIDFTVPELVNIEIEPQTLVSSGTEIFAGQTVDAEIAEIINNTISNNAKMELEEREISIMADGLKTVTFASGNQVSFTLESTMPTSNLIYTPDVYLVLPDNGTQVETKIEFVDAGNGKYVADFSGVNVSVGNITLSGYVTLSGSVAAGDTISEGGIGVNLNVEASLDKGFASVTATVPEETELSKTIDYELPGEIQKMVSKVSFNQAGVKLKVNNSLPAGNDIDINMNIPAFNNINITKTAVNGNNELEFINDAFEFFPSVTPNIQMSMNVELPGYDVSSNTVTVSNVKPGESYGLEGTLEIVTDWTSLVLKSEDSFLGTFPEEEPFDLTEMMKFLPEGIHFNEIGTKLYLSSTVEDLKLSGTVKVNDQYLLGSDSSSDIISMQEKLVLPSQDSCLWETELPVASADFTEGMTSFINSKPDNMSLTYSLNIDEVEIAKEDVDANAKVCAEFVLQFPIELKIQGDEVPDNVTNGSKYVKFDIMEIANVYSDEPDANNDLFGRENPSVSEEEESDIDTILEKVGSMALEVEYNNQLGFATLAEFKDETSGIQRFFTLEKGNGTLKLNFEAEEIIAIKDTYPFSPRIYIYIPNTNANETFMLRKDATLDVKIAVSEKSELDYTIDFSEGE